MKISRSIFLTFLSLTLILPGCYMSKYSKSGVLDMSDPQYEQLMPFGERFQKALYKATLEVNGHYFSGLMMIKASGKGNYKLTFFNEVGMNFFDFELVDMGGKNRLNLYVKNIYDPLDKDMLLNKFEKYFSMLLAGGPAGGVQKTYLKQEGIGIMIMQDSYKGKDGYITTNLVEPYKQIVNIGGFRKRDRVTIDLEPDKTNHCPQTITIRQPGFRLEFKLKLVE